MSLNILSSPSFLYLKKKKVPLKLQKQMQIVLSKVNYFQNIIAFIALLF